MSDQDAAMNRDYGTSGITVLEGLEAIRRCPDMYIGSTGEWGLHRLVYEAVDNSADEALAGYCDHVEIAIPADGGVRVSDNGRGIPVDEHPTEHKPTAEIVTTILHADGKFGGGDYAVSGGLHGVGISVVSALSTRVDTEVCRQGFVQCMSFADDGCPIAELVRGEAVDSTGATQTSCPDPTIFETADFDYEMLRRRLQQMAFLNEGLCTILAGGRLGVQGAGDEVVGDSSAPDAPEVGFRTDSHCCEHDLCDYVAFLNRFKKAELIHPGIVDFEAEQSPGENRSISLKIAVQWTNVYSESAHTYANTIDTAEGGTHEEGFRTVLTTLVNKYVRGKGLLRGHNDNLTGDDTREGLAAVIPVKLSEPQLEDQIKTRLGNTEARAFVQQTVYAQLGDWLDSHPGGVRIIITKVPQAAVARLIARKIHGTTRRKGVPESASIPGKLRDCSSKNAADSEIFIVEGDSAGGSAIGGRSPGHQAVVPICDKILNAEKACPGRALPSDMIRNLITTLGARIGEDFDIVKLYCGKIVVMADADVDGQHVATLLLTLLFRYMRPLIEYDHTYVAMSSLYRLKWSNTEHEFIYSDVECDKLLVAGQEKGRRLPKDGRIRRYKGLGEMNDHELQEMTMGPTTRISKQVMLDGVIDADETFATLMDDDVKQRRSFIQRNTSDVCFLDI